MNTIEAIKSRRSVRAFSDTPVEKEKIDAILEAAVWTPSWANSQPWEIFVASGETLDRIKAGFKEKHENKEKPFFETPAPAAWSEAAKDRQKQLRPGMVAACGEEAADDFAMLNRTAFNAPMVIYLCMDKILSEWSLYDIGAYSQSLMLAAKELGLGTIPAAQLMLFPDVLRKEMDIPENLKFTIGIAIGYEDTEHGINKFKATRSPLSETVRFFE